jgi:hypothetical protein
MNGTFSPSLRPFVCIAHRTRSMVHCFSAWTRMPFPCRRSPALLRYWQQTGLRSCSRRGMNTPLPPSCPTRFLCTQSWAKHRSCRWNHHHAFAQSAPRRRVQIQSPQWWASIIDGHGLDRGDCKPVSRSWPGRCEEDSFRKGPSRLHDTPARLSQYLRFRPRQCARHGRYS